MFEVVFVVPGMAPVVPRTPLASCDLLMGLVAGSECVFLCRETCDPVFLITCPTATCPVGDGKLSSGAF